LLGEVGPCGCDEPESTSRTTARTALKSSAVRDLDEVPHVRRASPAGGSPRARRLRGVMLLSRTGSADRQP